MFPAVPYSRFIIEPIPWYSVLIVTGVVLAIYLGSREEKRLGFPADTVLDLTFWVLPLGIIGARLYYVIFAWEMFAADPLAILRVWEGGLAIYGGIIGGVIGLVLFCRRRRLPLITLTDMAVPCLALAQAIGRWGNYFNMEAYGRAITDSRWQFFPAGVLIPEGGEYVWHMATFFYESMWNLAVFAVLWFIVRKRPHRAGTVTLWYMLLYGTGRFFIEGLRTDSLMSGTVRVSQLLSAALVAVAVVALILRDTKNKTQKEAA